MTKEITKEEWEPIADIYGYIGYFRGESNVCLDGDFDLNDLRRIITWLEKRLADDQAT